MTQCERILAYIEQYGSITSKTAMDEYGIMRLASRISELRRQGVPIAAQIVIGKNRYGEKIRYSEYMFMNKKEIRNEHD